MNPDTLIQRGNPGYSKQQKQLRGASSAPAQTQTPATAIATTGKQYNAGGGVINPYGTIPVVTTANTPVTSAAMTPTTPVTLPTPVQPTAAAGVSGAVEAYNNANLTAQQRQDALIAEQAKTATDSKSEMSKTLADLMGVNTEMSQAASTIDRSAEDAARKRNDELVTQMEANSLAARRKIEALQQNNPQGLFGGALQDEVNRIQRDVEITNADLAIQQNAALRNYQTANAIADRQLELKLEPLKLKAENLKLFYDANKDIWSKADDRVFAAAKDKADRELAKATAVETQLTELKKNVAQYAGANANTVLSQLSKIDTTQPGAVDKALAIAGKYQSDPLDRAIKNAQLSKLNADISKTRSEIKSTAASGGLRKLDDTEYSKFTSNPNYEAINNGSKYTSALSGFKDAVKKYGTADFSATGQGELNAAYSNLVASTKDYYKLGTLDAGVEKLVSLGVPAPGKFRTRDKKVLSSLDVLKSEADKNIKNAKDRLSNSVYGDTTEFATLLSSIESPQSEEDYLDTVDQTLSTVNSPYSMYLNE